MGNSMRTVFFAAIMMAMPLAGMAGAKPEPLAIAEQGGFAVGGAVVAYEPGSGFVFPEGEVPDPMPFLTGTLEGFPVPSAEFMKLAKIPIAVYYGDNIPEQTDVPGQDNWRVRLAMARLWVDAINGKGGDAKLVHLPEIGVYGNPRFPFSDLNNLEIADLMETFLKAKGLN